MSVSFLPSFSINEHSRQDLAQLWSLTRREWEVVALLSRGMATSEIAAKICVEPKSVDNYRRKIADKLKLKGRNKLAFYCLRNKDTLEQLYEISISARH
ncbi:response regulator transcription factor [Dyadobacter crusticola]|uniref:response regulator transcription factor n=1 Tax=Dyadobacter crusticola TaxID=292407 RepID=UPI0009FE2BCD|nr:helix-turn-helix transcriptional regulator [Dyadobacter crusticola]